jgi:hypothetical protein
MEDWEFDRTWQVFVSHVELSTWAAARLDTQSKERNISVGHINLFFSYADPRVATGYCASVLGASLPFEGNYPSTATGGVSSIVFSIRNWQSILNYL